MRVDAVTMLGMVTMLAEGTTNEVNNTTRKRKRTLPQTEAEKDAETRSRTTETL